MMPSTELSGKKERKKTPPTPTRGGSKGDGGRSAAESRELKSLLETASIMKSSSSLIEFVRYTYPGYAAAYHHYQICKALEMVEIGEIKRLMIFMPPRHGKSELGSVRFPAWYLGRNPGKEVIACSYNSELASDFGRKVRGVVGSEEFLKVFGVGLSKESRAVDRWHTDRGGAYVAAGVGTAVTGRGADLLLIDDPLKDRQEADSETTRKGVWDWYTSTAYTRLMPGGAVILIQTRWHEDDLAGRLLESQEHGDKWVVLNLPAEKNGKALWPDRYPIEVLDQIKGVIGSRDWNSLYQQEPTPDEGLFFERGWFHRYDVVPKNLKYYGASDYAVTDGGGDWTVHGICGVDELDNIYITDWWKGQTSTEIWVDRFCELVKLRKPLMWGEESGQIEKGVGPFLSKRQREENAYCYRKPFSSVRDKSIRAQSIRGRLAQGRVYFPKVSWADDLIEEMIKFPAGKHDDQVDVMSLFGRMLDTMVPAQADKKRKIFAMGSRPSFSDLMDIVSRRRAS